MVNMDDRELPNELNVGLTILEYFNPGAEVVKHDKRGLENIALIKDPGMDLETDQYYTVIYHDNGYVICLYSQKLESLFGSMVVYKKIKWALDNGNLEEAWHELTTKSKDDRKYEHRSS